MLKDDLYVILGLEHTRQVINATIQLDATHTIFAGHFPGQPVLPGVCMMQMVREVLETALGKRLRLVKAANIKFIALVTPSTTPLHIQLSYSVDENVKVKAVIIATDTLSFKADISYTSSHPAYETPRPGRC